MGVRGKGQPPGMYQGSGCELPAEESLKSLPSDAVSQSQAHGYTPSNLNYIKT